MVWSSTDTQRYQKTNFLKPSTTWNWTYKSPENPMITGIYSHETMNALQKHLLFPQEIVAAQKNIARQSLGYIYSLHRPRPQTTKPHRRKHHWANGKNVGMVYHCSNPH